MEIDVEAVVIRAILAKPETFDEVAEILSPNDFSTIKSRAVFSCAQELRANDQTVDLFTIIERVGYQDWIQSLMREPMGVTHMVAARAVERESLKRRALAELDAARGLVCDARSTGDILSATANVGEGLEIRDADYVVFNDLAKNCLMRLEDRINGKIEHKLKTGFEQVDQRIVGLSASDLMIIAGRPAMGKTTYAMNIVENVSMSGGNVLVFSLEMSKEQLLDRMMCSLSGVDAHKIKTGKGLTEEDYTKISAGSYKLKNISPIIIDKPAISIGHATNIARKINRKTKLDLIVVDYLQLMRSDSQNRFEEISEISRGLKALAKTTGTPVIALSQLSRAVDSRTNNRPVNSDLRESGQIEQDADLIQFLYRDEIYNTDSPHVGVCEVITTKFRSGETGTDFLSAELSKNRFQDLSYRPEPQIKKEYIYGK